MRSLKPNDITTTGLLLIAILLAIGWALTWWRHDNYVRSTRLLSVDHMQRLEQIEEELDAAQNNSSLRALIVAVTDPDPEISITADQILRRESGIRDGFGQTAGVSDDGRFRLMSKWCEWYLRERAKSD